MMGKPYGLKGILIFKIRDNFVVSDLRCAFTVARRMQSQSSWSFLKRVMFVVRLSIVSTVKFFHDHCKIFMVANGMG